MARQVYIDIPKGMKGEVKTEGHGFANQDCRTYTDPIKNFLGGQVTHDENKNEAVDTELVKELA